MVLYRKYRPQALSEVLGQDHITTTLVNALRTNRLAHAYLFSGPRGTGKTSVARILAKAVNCMQDTGKELGSYHEPCNQCDSCVAITNGTHLDLWEIDAASNRGIDDVRELREKVFFRPSSGNKKVYVLDEVHMLTNEAFNALLKTLEEPPEHTLFILCTTESHKVPSTIISRCQRFDFSLADEERLVQCLKDVALKEGIKIDDEALKLLSKNATGSYRDVLGLMEQIVNHSQDKEIDAQRVRELLGLPDELQVQALIKFITQKRIDKVLDFINQVYDEGLNLHELTKSVISYLREELIASLGKSQKIQTSEKEALSQEEILRLITLLVQAEKEIKNAPIQQLPLELSLLEFISEKKDRVFSSVDVDGEEKRANSPKLSSDEKELSSFPSRAEEFPLQNTTPDMNREGILEKQRNSQLQKSTINVEEFWPQILASLRPHNHTLEALLKSATPKVMKNGILTLVFLYPFHKERIEETKNRELVERVVSEVVGEKVRVRCMLEIR